MSFDEQALKKAFIDEIKEHSISTVGSKGHKFINQFISIHGEWDEEKLNSLPLWAGLNAVVNILRNMKEMEGAKFLNKR